MSVPTGAGNYPPGVTDNDPHFEGDDYEEDYEHDEFEEAAGNCHAFFEGGPNGVFVCMAIGSEDCDECPFNKDLGLTAQQIQDAMNED